MKTWEPVKPSVRWISKSLRRATAALDQFASDAQYVRPSIVAFDGYVERPPSAQNAVDSLAGWSTPLPPDVGAIAGPGVYHSDPRILWALEQFGPIEGRDILELGPLEASHTFMLEQGRPASILAIEANRLSFLRCLVVKELLSLKIAKFTLGNFAPWLETAEQRFDLIVASGVLYHMADPVRLLELLSRRTDSLYLWTHYASDEAMPRGDMRRLAFVGDVEVIESHGVAVRVHCRSYWGASKNKAFCGGLYDTHRWVEKDDILKLLRALDFNDIRTAHDDPGHHNGPAFSVFARRQPV